MRRPALPTRLLALACLAGLVAACTVPTPPPPTPVPSHLFEVRADTVPELRKGLEFGAPTNNCGSTVPTQELFRRSRQFTREVELSISETLAAELGGGIPATAEAKLSAEIAAALNLRLGEEETVEVERRIETPADSIKITYLQWQEQWATGVVTVSVPFGTFVETSPFRALDGMSLAQTRVEVLDCALEPPDRPVDVSASQAFAANNALIAGAFTGSVMLSEAMASSLLSFPADGVGPAAAGEGLGVRVWFEPENRIFVSLPASLTGIDADIDLAGVVADEGQGPALHIYWVRIGDRVLPAPAVAAFSAALTDRLGGAQDAPAADALDTALGAGLSEAEAAALFGIALDTVAAGITNLGLPPAFDVTIDQGVLQLDRMP